MDNQIEIIQVDGQAVFTSDEQGNKYVQFLPDDPVEQFVEGWRHEGVAQRLRNGTLGDAYQEGGPRAAVGHEGRGHSADAEDFQE